MMVALAQMPEEGPGVTKHVVTKHVVFRTLPYGFLADYIISGLNICASREPSFFSGGPANILGSARRHLPSRIVSIALNLKHLRCLTESQCHRELAGTPAHPSKIWLNIFSCIEIENTAWNERLHQHSICSPLSVPLVPDMDSLPQLFSVFDNYSAHRKDDFSNTAGQDQFLCDTASQIRAPTTR